LDGRKRKRKITKRKRESRVLGCDGVPGRFSIMGPFKSSTVE
jgi:hypothetical protein